MNEGLRVAFAFAELAPFATTGGLGDVAAALPRALASLGHRVAVFLPLYRSVRERAEGLAFAASIHVPGFDPHPHYRVFATRLPADGDVELYLVEHDRFFDRDGVYGDRFGEFGDNLERYAFFSLAVLEAILALGLEPDVIHTNDWHTALVPAYLRTLHYDDPVLRQAASLFTIHNLAYQGRFAASRFPATRLPWSVFHPGGVEFYGDLDCMKAGIVFADAVGTVSPRYAQEITTPEYGEGLDGVLRSRGSALVGILNGIDTGRWDPATDPFLPARYSPDDLAGKQLCKEALLAELGLVLPPDAPLVGMVSRLTWQKGCDIVLGVAEDVLRAGASPGAGTGLVLLGSGDGGLEHGFRALAARHPDRVAVRIGFDEALAHRIEGGADLFLMPSRYEPCGLNQMYSLRYGTVPVVRACGGLDDTVRDVADEPESGNGFKFRGARGDELVAALRRAVALRRDRGRWERLLRRGMCEDFSWRRSAAQYAELYARLRR